MSFMPVTVKFARCHKDAILPTRATDGSAGYDVCAVLDGTMMVVPPGGMVMFRTGLMTAFPAGYGLFLLSRSGHALKHSVRLANCVALVDSDYRNEIKVLLHNDSGKPFRVAPGDRIAQLVLKKLEDINFEEVTPEELAAIPSSRDGGFSSTGGISGQQALDTLLGQTPAGPAIVAQTTTTLPMAG